jgi:hypothetical protein
VKSSKPPAIHNISKEMMKADKERDTKWLKIFDKFWAEEETTSEWSSEIKITVPKKGDLSRCSNWRGLTLLFVPNKVSGNILI